MYKLRDSWSQMKSIFDECGCGCASNNSAGFVGSGEQGTTSVHLIRQRSSSAVCSQAVPKVSCVGGVAHLDLGSWCRQTRAMLLLGYV